MPRVKQVTARKDYPEFSIKKGDRHYTWHPKGRPWQRSITRPRPSQLTQSAFLSTIYAAGEDIQDAHIPTTLTERLEEGLATAEELRDEAEDNLGMLPEQLQEGHMLTGRIEAVEEFIELLEGFDYDDPEEPDEPTTKEPEDKESLAWDDWESERDDWVEEQQTWETDKEEALEELQNISYGGE